MQDLYLSGDFLKISIDGATFPPEQPSASSKYFLNNNVRDDVGIFRKRDLIQFG